MNISVSFISNTSIRFSQKRTMKSSENTVILNEFENFWRPFIRIAQFFSVSHFSIFRPHLRENLCKSALFLMYFLSISAVHIFLVSLTMRKGLRCEDNMPEHKFAKHKESPLMYYLNIFTVLGTFATHLATHLEALLCGRQEMAIYNKFEIIDEIFATKLNYWIDYKQRRAKFIKKTVSVFVLTCILAITSSFTSLPDVYHDKYFMQPILIFAVVVNRVRWCYVSIFLCTIADTLKDLQILLIKQQTESGKQLEQHRSKGGFEREKIQYFRQIYSNVWLAVTHMSGCFGLSLISFLLEFIFEIISGCYWLYINFSIYGSRDLNIRKFRLQADF